MGFIVFFLICALVWLWSNVNEVSGRLARLTEQLASSKDQVGELAMRVRQLERGGISAPRGPEPAPVAAPPAPAPVVAPPPVAARPPVVPERPIVVPPAIVTPRPVIVPLPVMQAAPVMAVPSESAPAMVAKPSVTERAESWEMTVGTSWFNKIGVLVFIIGVALLVSYTFSRVGPAGRVAVGFALSFGMLGSGVFLERLAAFRNYAYGLVAGGWAGVYFTTYAMHDIPAAKIIDNPVTAVVLLTAVAAGMIAHSLRYRSQVVTSLAFVVAYITLALSPVSGFSLAASVPLALSVLLVSQRLGWAGVSALGIVATYGAFALRGALFQDGVLNPESALPYVVLATYWLTFEAADIAGLRTRGTTTPAGAVSVPMIALNAIGFMGAMLLTVPRDNGPLLAAVLFSAAGGYVASAMLRAWLLPGWRARHAADEPFDSTHGATAIAAALFAFAIGLRFSGNRESVARLLEAQLLITAGLTLGDVWLRRFGSIGLALAAAHAWLFAGASGTGAPVFTWSMGVTSAVLLLIAAAGYGSREAIHRRAAQPVWLERAFPWMATVLVTTVCVMELDPAHQALAGVVLAMVLLEVGFRRTREYIIQAYVTGGLAVYAMVAAFLITPDATGVLLRWGVGPSSLDEWIVLPAGMLLTAGAAWRLATRSRAGLIPGGLAAAGAAAIASTALLLLFEWRVLSPNSIAPAWALTAVGLVAAGAWRRLPLLRWQAYVVGLAATVRAVGPLLDLPPTSTVHSVAVGLVIAAVYAVAYIGRRGLVAEGPAQAQQTSNSFEAETIGALSVLATASLAVFKWRVLPELVVAPAWAATGLVLIALGLHRATVGQRRQGYALVAIGAIRGMGSLLEQPFASVDPSAALSLWSLVLVATVYVAAWLPRRSATGAGDAEVVALPLLGTVALALLESRVLADIGLGPGWTATGVVLLTLGTWKGAVDLRWQGYALLGLGALRTSQPVFGVPEPATAAIVWLAVVIGALYASGVMVRRMTRAAAAAGKPEPAEDVVGSIALIGGTVMLALLILQEVRPSMVTLALGLQGLGLMFAGLVARERVMRLSGLALLMGCILKLFVYDLREREAIERILSFVMLGLFLLAISWTYTKYREQIKKFL